MIFSYLDQLQAKAASARMSLKEAFEAAGVPDSTYYRAVNGTTDLRLETAKKVADILDHMEQAA